MVRTHAKDGQVLYNLKQGKRNIFAELVKWQGETCYVVAFLDAHSEGLDVRTVGMRPFDLEGKEQNDFSKLCVLANDVYRALYMEDE